MFGRLRKIAALTIALALTASPVLGCCAGLPGHAHAAGAEGAPAAHSGHSGRTAHAAMAEHCADADSADFAGPAVSGGTDDCATCATCAEARLMSREGVLAATVSADKDAGLPPAAARADPDPVPALRRVFAPPHGPPVPHDTPVSLRNTLRL